MKDHRGRKALRIIRRVPRAGRKIEKEHFRRRLKVAIFGDIPAVEAVAEYLGISERTVRDRIKEHGGYIIKDGRVYKKSRKKSTGKTESPDIPAEE